MASVYTINKGINKPVVFKGLRAQYIWYLGGGLIALLIVFALLFICGVNNYVSLVITIILGSFLIGYVFHLSNKYGEHGMMKKIAKRSIPQCVKSYSRKEYLNLKK